MSEIVRVKSAPGLKWKKRAGETFEARWQCRYDLTQRPDFEKFNIKSVKLWTGTGDPTLEEWDFIADTCRQLQQEMLVWANGGLPDAPPFDGTLAGLIKSYRTDPDSAYKREGALRHASRVHYDAVMGLIERQYGAERLAELKGRLFQRWYDGWSADGKVAIAHAKMRMLRMLFSYGTALLEDADCIRLSTTLSKMKFSQPKPRSERLMVGHVNLIRAKAHEMGCSSIAIAQSFQFELMLRQKDVIGEYVPLSEKGTSDVIRTNEDRGTQEKWLRGIRWSEIDESLTIRHMTSKRNKPITVNLLNSPMVRQELNIKYPGCVFQVEIISEGKPIKVWRCDRSLLPASGPIVVREETGLPWVTGEFRRIWRKVADACEIPKTIRNMDSRAGAISEAIAAGAKLEHVRHSATHSDIGMTQRYDRSDEEATAEVQRHRNMSRTE